MFSQAVSLDLDSGSAEAGADGGLLPEYIAQCAFKARQHGVFASPRWHRRAWLHAWHLLQCIISPPAWTWEARCAAAALAWHARGLSVKLAPPNQPAQAWLGYLVGCILILLPE